MSYDALLGLLSGARPTNAASFMDPFGAYDLAGMVARGLVDLTCGNRMIVGGGVVANTFSNIAQPAGPVRTQALGQTGTLTKKTDGFLGGSATRPSIEWSNNNDLKVALSTSPIPATGEFWVGMSIVPLQTQVQLFGTGSSSSKMSCTMVNTDIRFNLASSGSGGFSLATTPDGANLVNRTWNVMCGRRASDNKTVIRWHLAGQAAWAPDVVNSQAATTGAGGTGSSLTLPGDIVWGSNTVSTGYSPYSRRSVEWLWVGTPSAQDLIDLKQIMDMYSGL